MFWSRSPIWRPDPNGARRLLGFRTFALEVLQGIPKENRGVFFDGVLKTDTPRLTCTYPHGSNGGSKQHGMEFVNVDPFCHEPASLWGSSLVRIPFSPHTHFGPDLCTGNNLF